MQKRTMAILGVIFAGLLAYVLLVEVGREEQREEREDLAKQILPTTEDDVRRLVIERQQGAVEIVRDGDTPDAEWLVVQPFEGPADPAAASAAARAAATLEGRRRIEPAKADLTQYGLEQPELTVTLEAVGLDAPVVMRFGGQTGSKDGRYLQIDGEADIRIVPSHQVRALDKGVDDLRDRRLVRFSPGSAERVTLSGTGGPVALVHDDGTWWVDGDPRYRAARMDLDDLLADLTTSRATRFLDGDDPGLGLEGSDRWVRVALEDGREVQVTFGERRGTALVAQVEGSVEAAEVSSTIADPLDWTADRWHTLEVADINPWQTSRLTFTFGDRTFEFLPGDDDSWTLTEGDGDPAEVAPSRARAVLAQIDQLEGVVYLTPGEAVDPEVGSFEIEADGRPLVRFTLHRSGDTWTVGVAGDPASMQVPGTLGLFLEEFLADPMGSEDAT